MTRPISLFRVFAFTLILLSIGSYSFAEDDSLGINLTRYDTEEDGIEYDIQFGAEKDGAVTCELITPYGTFSCIDIGDQLDPGQDFWAINNILTRLSFAELNFIISSNWTLTWDKGLATQTIATIGFGVIAEDDWLQIPLIATPLDGASNISPNTSVDWAYSVPTAQAQEDIVEVIFVGPNNVVYSSDELPLLTTSWSPPSVLSPGSWTAGVSNGISDFRSVADGIGGPIVGDPWILENDDWLALISEDTVIFTVQGDSNGDDGDDDDDDDGLEIILEKHDTNDDGIVYDICLQPVKTGATTCEIITPRGTFSCFKIICLEGDNDFYDNHINLSFAELDATISSNWTLTWDKGLATQTIATIGIGIINENDWLALPTITNPLEGTINVSPNTSIDWTYSVPAAQAQTDMVEAFFYNPNSGVSSSSDELPLLSTSWTPPSALSPGLWYAGISNGISDVRSVADGIGGSIVGDPWVFDNDDWLAITSISTTVFTVQNVVADIVLPSVISTNPTNNAIDKVVTTDITATFSENINPSTVTPTSFLLSDGSTNISGNITLIGTIATLSPDVNLAYDTTYTATLTTDVEDIAGNALSANYVWSFTTQDEGAVAGLSIFTNRNTWETAAGGIPDILEDFNTYNSDKELPADIGVFSLSATGGTRSKIDSAPYIKPTDGIVDDYSVNGSTYFLATTTKESNTNEQITITFDKPVTSLGIDLNPHSGDLGDGVGFLTNSGEFGTLYLPSTDVTEFRGFVTKKEFISITFFFSVDSIGNYAEAGWDNLAAHYASVDSDSETDTGGGGGGGGGCFISAMKE